jgi:uncharacterized membrane protein YecN with MAPEG domain
MPGEHEMSAVPLVTALYGAIIGLLGAFLTINVIRHRVATKVNDGDGGSTQLRMAMRAHANFAQLVPLTVLLIGFSESLGTPKTIIHGVGAALVLARLLSAQGLLSVEGQSFGRQAGAGLTVLVLIAASVLILLREGGIM